MHRSNFFFAIVLLSGTSPATASAVDDAVDSYYRGDYGTAVELLSQHPNDGRAQRYLGMIYDKNHHALWEFTKAGVGVSVYDGGIAPDREKMLEHYGQAIMQRDLIARYHYCDWVASPLWKRGSFLKNSKCKRLWVDAKKAVRESPDDPFAAFYAWIIGSGDVGTADRRNRAIELLTPGARAGNHVHQFYLARVHLGFNPRFDRPANDDDAYAWFALSATDNYHARVYLKFLHEALESEGKLASAVARADELVSELQAAARAAE